MEQPPLHGAVARGCSHRVVSGCGRKKPQLGLCVRFVSQLHGAAAIACISRHCMEQPLAGARIGLSLVAAGKSRNWDWAYVSSHYCMHQPPLHGAAARGGLASGRVVFHPIDGGVRHTATGRIRAQSVRQVTGLWPLPTSTPLGVFGVSLLFSAHWRGINIHGTP